MGLLEISRTQADHGSWILYKLSTSNHISRIIYRDS